MGPSKTQILLSNDDGIDSPGLWAAAEALSELGYVTVAAPRDHMSATGRGYQKNSDGMITKKKLTVNGQEWDVYAVGGSPSQSVAHGVLEIVSYKPDLVVTGINFGENLGTDVTWSGTVGAAIEAATLGIPGLAMSQQIIYENWDGDPMSIDFSPSAYFTKYFAKLMLEKQLPEDVHVLNVVVPVEANPETTWKVTPLSDLRYFRPYVEREGGIEEKGRIRSRKIETKDIIPGNDIHTVRVEGKVSVTPLSVNLTSRTDLSKFEALLRSEK
jgi:5'-nucleotidase